MKPTDIFIRTEKGAEVIRTNAELNSKHRLLFIMIDGRLSVADLMRQGHRLGIEENAFHLLEENGFIRNISSVSKPDSTDLSTGINSQNTTISADSEPNLNKEIADPYYHAQNFMRETIVDAAGIRSYFFILKLEQTMNLEDLKALLPQYEKTLRKGLGDIAANMLIEKLKSIMETH
jgi:hypothetical protein